MARLFRRIGEMANAGQRLWIELEISQADIDRRGMNTYRPGPKLFTGLWYGKDPLDFRNYGKMVEPGGAYVVATMGRNIPARTLNRLK